MVSASKQLRITRLTVPLLLGVIESVILEPVVLLLPTIIVHGPSPSLRRGIKLPAETTLLEAVVLEAVVLESVVRTLPIELLIVVETVVCKWIKRRSSYLS